MTFGLLDVPDFRLRYNVAPTRQVLTITLRDGKQQGIYRRWGLVLLWADDPSIGYRRNSRWFVDSIGRDRPVC